MSDSESLQVLLLAGRMEIRGSCAYSLRLAQRLPDCGIETTLISPDLQRLNRPLRERLNAREYRRIETPLWGCYVRECLLHDLRSAPPDLIHIQSRRALPLGTWLARRLQLPWVLTVHGHLLPHERLWFDRGGCQKIIAVSESVRDDLIARQRVPPELLTVIPAGVDVPAEDCSLPALDPGHVPVIGTAGPLESAKGVPYFLAAARLVFDVRPELEFLVAGAGPEEANLRRVARELGIAEKVTFVPYLPDFAESLAAIDIYCVPALQQGPGTVMLEAMARGRPVIATDVQGIDRIIRDGETGLIVPPAAPSKLAEKILELLDNPARARAIGSAARQLVADEFDAGRMVLHTAELYREICACLPKSSPLAPN